jgi:hypothetical protein
LLWEFCLLRADLRFAIALTAAEHRANANSPRIETMLGLPSVGDNAAMNKPFQFSMRSMFAAVACFCVFVASICTLIKHTHDPDFAFSVGLALFFAAVISCGAGLGAICGKLLKGAAWGALCAIVIALIWLVAPAVQR